MARRSLIARRRSPTRARRAEQPHREPERSPDGTRLAWSERDGIWVSPIAAGAGDCGAAPKRLIPGGSQPDWAKADLA
jgi:hypothetical protein